MNPIVLRADLLNLVFAEIGLLHFFEPRGGLFRFGASPGFGLNVALTLKRAIAIFAPPIFTSRVQIFERLEFDLHVVIALARAVPEAVGEVLRRRRAVRGPRRVPRS